MDNLFMCIDSNRGHASNVWCTNQLKSTLALLSQRPVESVQWRITKGLSLHALQDPLWSDYYALSWYLLKWRNSQRLMLVKVLQQTHTYTNEYTCDNLPRGDPFHYHIRYVLVPPQYMNTHLRHMLQCISSTCDHPSHTHTEKQTHPRICPARDPVTPVLLGHWHGWSQVLACQLV